MANTVEPFTNINLLTPEQYSEITPSSDELWATQIQGWIPDLSNPIDSTSTYPYTVPDTLPAYACKIGLQTNDSSFRNVLVNGVEVARCGYDDVIIYNWITICAGDVITVGGTSNSTVSVSLYGLKVG